MILDIGSALEAQHSAVLVEDHELGDATDAETLLQVLDPGFVNVGHRTERHFSEVTLEGCLVAVYTAEDDLYLFLVCVHFGVKLGQSWGKESTWGCPMSSEIHSQDLWSLFQNVF